MVDPADQENGLNDGSGYQKNIEITKPWYVDELGDQMGRIRQFIKWVAILGGIILLGYLMFRIFGPIWLLGLLTVPAWVIYSIYQLDRESYILVERRIIGEELEPGKISQSREDNIYSIYPHYWKHYLQIRGEPVGGYGRIYFCNYFDPEDEIIYFPKSAKYSNIDLTTRDQYIEFLKRRLPSLEKENFTLRANMQAITMRRAVEFMGIIKGIDDGKIMDDDGYFKINVHRTRKETPTDQEGE